MLKDTNGDSVEKYLSDERAYAQFVYETSLLLTPEATAAMAEIFGEAPPALALSDILPLVLSALKENITYDETVKTDCGTNDFAAYVLRVGKRGYSVHYAACAVRYAVDISAFRQGMSKAIISMPKQLLHGVFRGVLF